MGCSFEESFEDWRKMEQARERYVVKYRQEQKELMQFPCYCDESVFEGTDNCSKTCPEIADSCKRRVAFQRNPEAAADLLESANDMRALIARTS